jgi:hypothetical protein
VQYAAEMHIVTLAAKGEATEWGCDAVWDGGDPVLENCTAVFGILYKLGDSSPKWLDAAYTEAPATIDPNFTQPFSMKDLDLASILPKDKSYYTYSGSLVWLLVGWPFNLSCQTIIAQASLHVE